MFKDRPIYSRCSLGQNRWFWVVYRSFEALCNGDDALAIGYTATAHEAEYAALSVEPNSDKITANIATRRHRDICNRKRAAKQPDGSTTTVAQEFLYRDWISECDEQPHSSRHLIVKRTKKLVFVEKANYRSDPWDRKTYALNRAELEASDSVWCRQAKDRFYTTPYEQRRQSWASPELTVLGVNAGASKDEVTKAYRQLARKHHPDCGGDPAKFIEIQGAYERAMAG